MGDWALVKLGFRGGVWQGRLSALGKVLRTPPAIEVSAGGVAVAGVELRPDGPGAWLLTVPVPAAALGDGIASFVVIGHDGASLATFAIATGEPADDDLRAEVALLRAELDMIKRHFRRLGRGD